MTEAFLSLGSNMGDRLEHLRLAVEMLDQPDQGICVKAVSPVFETDPVGYTEQDDFLNICVRIETELEPLALLDVCQAIEAALLRKRVIHWGPRTIDIDILTYGDIQMNTQRLTIPHPRMEERGFVQVPLLFLDGAEEVPQQWRKEVRYFGTLPKFHVE